MNTLIDTLLRAVILLLAAITILTGILVFPILASQIASDEPSLAGLHIPYLIVAELALGCALVALAALWILRRRVRRGRIFDRESLVAVDVIIGAAAVATVLTSGVAGHQLVFVPNGFLPLTAGLLVLALAGVGFVLTMVVMRRLLIDATALRSEMETVI